MRTTGYPARPGGISRLTGAIVLTSGLVLGLTGPMPDVSAAAGEEFGRQIAEERARPQDDGRIRRCGDDGQWFPADPDELRRMVDACLATETPVIPEAPLALIVPHAGFAWSGPVAGAAYSACIGREYERVIVLGLSHRTALRGASLLAVDAWETPLGRIQADTEAADRLLRSPVVREHPAAHENEHSTVNQYPFLQRALGSEFRMVELLVGELSDRDRTRLARALSEVMNDRTLLVVSSDFTHFGEPFGYVPFADQIPNKLAALNNLAVQEILQVDSPGWQDYLEKTGDTICGRNAIALLLETLAPDEAVRGVRAAFDLSGRRSGDWSSSVSYAGIVFWRDAEGLSEAEEQTLLGIARRAATHFMQTGQLLRLDGGEWDLTPRLRAPGAAFVTLTRAGELRGCIGHVAAMMSLAESVAMNAVQACRDARFTHQPVTAGELDTLTIEVSVLTPLRRLLEPRQVQVGRDGLMMINGENNGLLLPQIPVQQGWSRTEFLIHTCLKAGLPPDAWQDPATEILRFSARIFSEEDH